MKRGRTPALLLVVWTAFVLSCGLGACAAPLPPTDPAPAQQLPTYILVVATGSESVGVFARHADRLWPLTRAAAGDSALAPLPTEVLGPGDTLWLAIAVWWRAHPVRLPPYPIRRGVLNRIPIRVETRESLERVGG